MPKNLQFTESTESVAKRTTAVAGYPRKDAAADDEMSLGFFQCTVAAYVAPLAPVGRTHPWAVRMVEAASGSSELPGSEVVARRAALAAEWISNEGFYSPVKREMMADDFVFMGPVVGPLNTVDYLGTLGVFRVYDAFPDVQVDMAPFTQDPHENKRFWSIIRVTGTHTGALDLGDAKVPPSGKRMRVGPQAVSVTFNDADKVVRMTGGYIADVRDGETGDAGAMFAVMRAVGVPTPRPGGKLVKVLNWIGAKRKDYPKGRSHADDLPAAWASRGRKHGLRTADAWTAQY